MYTSKNEILDYIAGTMLPKIKKVDGYKTTPKLITRKALHYNEVTTNKSPTIMVIDGEESRRLHGNRVIADCVVILRCVVIDNTPGSAMMSDLEYDITQVVKNDLFLGNNLNLPISILTVNTDEGWLTPTHISEIRLSVRYTWIEDLR